MSWDRLIFVVRYRLCPQVLKSLAIIKPHTVIRWHRTGFRAYWRWKSRARGGRPKLDAEVRDLIREMSRANRLWGAPRIHGELLKLGIAVAQSTVAKNMARRRGPPAQAGKTFLRNHADGIAAVDLLVVPTVGLQVALLSACFGSWPAAAHSPCRDGTSYRRMGWSADHRGVSLDGAPDYLLRDRDAVYGQVVKRRLRGLGIRDRPVAPQSPWQNGCVERLIGSVRRECFDHTIVLGESHLRKIMAASRAYYNEVRTHLSLSKDTPLGRPIERTGRIIAQPILGGLHHRYARI
jgi:transposase InsO family protein